MISPQRARDIMRTNILGAADMRAMAARWQLPVVNEPGVPYSEAVLEQNSGRALLVLGSAKAQDGSALTINWLRQHFGCDPQSSEPCMYNQDWYLNEPFAAEYTLESRWYLIRREVLAETRSKEPAGQSLPSAILTAYTFFFNYFARDGEMLWKHDFVWCDDTDSNGDRIYTGRYCDPRGLNKNGFNVHRHLSIKSNYGCAPLID